MYKLIAEYTCDVCGKVQQSRDVAGDGDKWPDGWVMISLGPSMLRVSVCSIECGVKQMMTLLSVMETERGKIEDHNFSRGY